MDLDGTSVRSEHFWVWIIERTTATLVGKPRFELEAADLPFVSGHSVSEHLEHCVRKYAPAHTLEELTGIAERVGLRVRTSTLHGPIRHMWLGVLDNVDKALAGAAA